MSDLRELFELDSQFSFEVQGQGQNNGRETVVIKGFASLENDDRYDVRTDPREFPIDEFMTTPVLLANHKFWVDRQGNKVSAGRVLSAHPAKLRKIDSDSEWGVVKLGSNEQIATFPKSRLPRIPKGTKGLFVHAEVTEPDIVEQVKRGELSGLSWRGLARRDQQLDPKTNTVFDVFRDIDLWEISVVHMPGHVNTNFVVVRSTDGEHVGEFPVEDFRVWRIEVNKDFCKSTGMVREYLKTHRVEARDIHEKENSFIAAIEEDGEFDLDRAIRHNMGGARFWLAPPKSNSPQPTQDSLLAEFLEAEDISVSTSKGETMTATATPPKEEKQTQEGQQQETQEEQQTQETQSPPQNQPQNPPQNQPQEEQRDNVAMLSDRLSKDLSQALTPVFEKFVQGLDTNNNNLKELGERMVEAMKGATPQTQEEQEKPKESKETVQRNADNPLDGILKKMEEMQRNTENLNQAYEEVSRSLQTLGKVVPPTNPRQEQQPQKNSDDPNSLFDACFPIG